MRFVEDFVQLFIRALFKLGTVLMKTDSRLSLILKQAGREMMSVWLCQLYLWSSLSPLRAKFLQPYQEQHVAITCKSMGDGC